MVYCVRCTSPHAIKGSKMIWPIRPTITGFGRWAINLKSCGLRVKPKSNISNVSIGSTINIAFISPNELNLQCQTGKIGAGHRGTVDVTGIAELTFVDVALVLVKDVLYAAADLQTIMFVQMDIVRQTNT